MNEDNASQVFNGSQANPNYYPKTKDNAGGFLPPNVPLNREDAVQGEIGQSGTLIFTGFISGEEYNADLAGRTGLKLWDRMRRSDATVRASLQVVKLPILAAEWNVQPAADTDQAVAQAEFIKENLFTRINFHDFLREALTELEFGFSVFEKVFEVCDWQGHAYMSDPDKNGNQKQIVTARPGPYIMLNKLGPRKQLTILRWQTMDKTAGITQQTYSGSTFSIERDKLVIFTNDQEGDNYEGRSILRPAYMHWYYKNELYKIDAIAKERQGVGIPQLTAPSDANEEDKAKARAALKNLRANEQAYIEIPHGYIIDFMDMKGHTAIDPLPSIEHHDRQIMKNVLAQFLELGASRGGGGSHALSADQSRLFEQSLEFYAKKICEVINEQIVRQLIDFNFTVAPEGYPKVEHGKIADDNIKTTFDAVQSAATAGLLSPDPDLEQWLRDMVHAPDLPVEYRQDYNNRPRAQASTVADTRDPSTVDKDVDNLDGDDPEEGAPDLTGEEVEASDMLTEAKRFRDKLGKHIDGIQKRS